MQIRKKYPLALSSDQAYDERVEILLLNKQLRK
ncbi:hypothetical protein EPYR_00870 [Erwinia pyrifoliae DSM 12163]|nr:hypothetical protein EPYR_00870 [Erwinia pyrifoliae DSM 12163]